MATFGGLFFLSDHILQTTKNKSYCRASCVTGAQSEYSLCHVSCSINRLLAFRCMARNKDLDADALYRCQEHTSVLVEDIDLGVLWDEYGIVGDLVVSRSTRARLFLTSNS